MSSGINRLGVAPSSLADTAEADAERAAVADDATA